MKTFLIAAAASITALTGLATAAPAEARGYYERDYRDYRSGDYYRGDRRAYRDQRRHYRDQRRSYRNDRRYYRNCDSGTGGTIIGAIAGGLLGHEVAGRNGDRTAGVLIGGAVGAVAGRAIDRDC